MTDTLSDFSKRIEALELFQSTMLARLPLLLPAFPLPVVASIRLDGSKPAFNATGRTDTITHARTDKCTVTISVHVSYKEKSRLVDANKNVISAVYEVTTTVTVSERCEEGKAAADKTSIHVSEKTFAARETDEPATGETKRFDGAKVDTLDYPHGTKVKATNKAGKVKVEITYPNGQSDSVTIP